MIPPRWVIFYNRMFKQTMNQSPLATCWATHWQRQLIKFGFSKSTRSKLHVVQHSCRLNKVWWWQISFFFLHQKVFSLHHSPAAFFHLLSFPSPYFSLSLSLFPSLPLSLSLARFLFLSLSVGVCPFRVSAAVEIRSECRTQGDGVHRS